MEHTALDQLAPALAKAQAEIRGAAKTVQNTYFKSTYADIAAVWEAIREPLTKNGLSVVQSPAVDGTRVTVTTVLLHASGQFLKGTASAEVKDLTSQSVGSAVTYLRRYALSAFCGTYGDAPDDDGEAAQGRDKPVQAKAGKPEDYELWLTQAQLEVQREGLPGLQAFFKRSPVDIRRYATEVDTERWNKVKALAKTEGGA